MNALQEFFRYDAWATITLLDYILSLEPALPLEKVTGTDRTIQHTLTHLVASNQDYLEQLTGEKFGPQPKAGEVFALDELRRRSERISRDWERTLAEYDRIDATIPQDETWPETPHAQNLLVLQAIQHGIDHRTQICTTLSLLGYQHPHIDGWSYWRANHFQQASG